MKESIYKSFDELPCFLNAKQVADLLGRAKSLPPGIRQAHRVADAVKQGNTQLLLQQPDLKGDGRLGIAQPFPCPGETFQFCHF